MKKLLEILKRDWWYILAYLIAVYMIIQEVYK